MGPEVKTYEEPNKEQEGDKKQLEKQNIKPENADIVKRLGFNLKEGEKIDQKSLDGKMGEQFDKMKNSVGNNPESYAKLDGIKQSFSQILEKETDINEQLKLCEQFLKEYDIAASTEKGEYSQRANMQAENMKEEAQMNAKKTGEKYTEMQKMIKDIAELQQAEKQKLMKERQIQQANMQQVISAEQMTASATMQKFQEPTTIV